MPRLVVCEGDFYRDWFGTLKCNGNQWNIDESKLYEKADLNPLNARIDSLSQSFDSRLSTVENVFDGESFNYQIDQEQIDTIWILIFCSALVFSFGLGAIKGGQR